MGRQKTSALIRVTRLFYPATAENADNTSGLLLPFHSNVPNRIPFEEAAVKPDVEIHLTFT